MTRGRRESIDRSMKTLASAPPKSRGQIGNEVPQMDADKPSVQYFVQSCEAHVLPAVLVETTEFSDPSAMQSIRTKGKSCISLLRRIYIGYGLMHITRPMALMCYSFAGAAVFLFFEKQAEIDRGMDRSENLREMRRRIIVEMLSTVFNDTERFLLFVDGAQTAAISDLYDTAFTQYQSVVLSTYSKYDGNRKMHWDLGNALVYSWTVITTIGYGHLCPATVGGRIATMIYAIFGIPLMLSILSDLGKLLTKAMKYPFLLAKMSGRRICQYCTRMTREQILEADRKDKSTLEIFDLPIPVAICLVIGWIFICSAITLSWEKEWDYLVAFYFFFISLSTIGFGDVVPTDTRYLFLLFGNIMIGLALVSMCINLMQSKLEKINAQAAAAAASTSTIVGPSETKFLDAEMDGRPHRRGGGPKETIVDLEETVTSDDASAVYHHGRQRSLSGASELPPSRKQSLATKRSKKLDSDLKAVDMNGPTEALLAAEATDRTGEEVTHKKSKKPHHLLKASSFVAPTPSTFVSHHSFPASDCPEEGDTIAELSDTKKLIRRNKDKTTSVIDRRMHGDVRLLLQKPVSANGGIMAHRRPSKPSPEGLGDEYEDYCRILTKREILEQIIHESTLPKLSHN